MCKCDECGDKIEQEYFTMKIAGIQLVFHPRCLPQPQHQEYPDRRHYDQIKLPLEENGNET